MSRENIIDVITRTEGPQKIDEKVLGEWSPKALEIFRSVEMTRKLEPQKDGQNEREGSNGN